MLLLFAIGATNDLVDAPADRRAAPAKPIPAGLVTPGAARRVALAAGAGGLLLAAAGGPAGLLVAAAGLAVGLLYDQLALGNALADLEGDRVAGLTTVATSLGRAGARRLVALNAALVVAVAWLALAALGGTGAGLAVAAAGSVIVAVGVAGSWSTAALARRHAWEAQGIGLGLLVLGWTASLLAGGRL